MALCEETRRPPGARRGTTPAHLGFIAPAPSTRRMCEPVTHVPIGLGTSHPRFQPSQNLFHVRKSRWVSGGPRGLSVYLDTGTVENITAARDPLPAK